MNPEMSGSFYKHLQKGWKIQSVVLASSFRRWAASQVSVWGVSALSENQYGERGCVRGDRGSEITVATNRNATRRTGYVENVEGRRGCMIRGESHRRTNRKRRSKNWKRRKTKNENLLGNDINSESFRKMDSWIEKDTSTRKSLAF